jgi:hypothetical protein
VVEQFQRLVHTPQSQRDTPGTLLDHGIPRRQTSDTPPDGVRRFETTARLQRFPVGVERLDIIRIRMERAFECGACVLRPAEAQVCPAQCALVP